MNETTPPFAGEPPSQDPAGPSPWKVGDSLFGEEPKAANPAEPPPGLMTLLAGVFTEPSVLFGRLRRAPSWVAPLLLGIVLALAANLVWAHKVDMEAQVRGNFETMSQIMKAPMPEEALQKNLDAIHGQPYVKVALGAVLGTPFVMVVMALLLWGFSRLGAAEEEESTFQQSLSVVTVHYLVMAPVTVLAFLVMLVRPVGGQSLMHLMPSHLGFFLHPEGLLARGLLTLADPFYVWSFVVLAIGMRRTLFMKTWAILLGLGFFGFFGILGRIAGGIF